jgi:hypothetical protein
MRSLVRRGFVLSDGDVVLAIEAGERYFLPDMPMSVYACPGSKDVEIWREEW